MSKDNPLVSLFGHQRTRASIYATPQSTRTQRSQPEIDAADLSNQKAFISEPQRFNDTAMFAFPVTNVSTLVLTRTASARTLLVIQNQSDDPIWVNFGSAAVIGLGIMLSPGDIATGVAGGAVFYDSSIPQGEVHMISNVAGPSQVIVQYANQDFVI